jgi:endonuclease/exonuclease/phosphatase family metal-dependent hydrolase
MVNWKGTKKIRLLSDVIVLFLFSFSTLSYAESSDKITIGSFNIQIFSVQKVKRQKTLHVLAETATHFDILAIQEAGSNDSKATDDECNLVMQTYTAEINTVEGADVYNFVHENQYGIIYRTDKVQLKRWAAYSGSIDLTYTPLIAYFKVINGDFDFCLVTVHTRPNDAKTEIPELKTVMQEVSKEYGDPDVLCAGDYNGDIPYYEEGSGENLADFDGYITGIPNSADTNVASSSKTYDRMEMTPSLNTDFTGSWGVFIISNYYDVSHCEGTKKTQGTEAALSDHYPVWCSFYEDRDRD